MRVHGASNGFGDLRKIDFTVHERFDRHFVRRVQYCRQRAADFTGLAREFVLDGITVNTVAPCLVQTQQLLDVQAVNPGLVQTATDVIPMGRPATEAEISSMVAYLASPEASFVTGQVISVNGGTTML